MVMQAGQAPYFAYDQVMARKDMNNISQKESTVNGVLFFWLCWLHFTANVGAVRLFHTSFGAFYTGQRPPAE